MEAAAVANDRIKGKYIKDAKVGQGTYADVYLGREIATGRQIAIKKIKVGAAKTGLDLSAIREVKFLRELNHPNVIELLDVFLNKSNLNLVLEFLDTDLEAVIKDSNLVFQAADVKSWMLMMLKGLEYCHKNFVLHRDMKPNNLLIARDGTLKIADFGLAREYADENTKMTCQVVTLWYRSPELLFGARSYSTGVDMWASGCIFAELMLRVAFMQGENDIDQLNQIFKVLGSPTEEEWPGHKALVQVQFDKQPKLELATIFRAATTEAVDLLSRFLAFDPLKRINANDALHHSFFRTAPHPTHPSKLPKPTPKVKATDLSPEESMTGKKRKAVIDPTEARKIARKLSFVG